MEERKAGSVVFRTVEDICIVDRACIPRSILVTGFETSTKSETLVIHFQRKQNGGGDIESITRSFTRGAAVITFENREVVTSVLQKAQKCDGVVLTVLPYLDAEFKTEVFELVSAELCLEFVESISREQMRNLLREVEAKTGVGWLESCESFSISGTLRQVEKAQACLQKCMHLANGIELASDYEMVDETAPHPRENSVAKLHENRHEVEEDVDQGPPPLVAEDKGPQPLEGAQEMHTDQVTSSPSHAVETLGFEIQPKIVKAFVEAHEKELDDIETMCRVSVPRKVEGNKIHLKPMAGCSGEEYERACDLFITLYQNTYPLIKMERFSLKSEAGMHYPREAMRRMDKQFPISLERSKDQKHWEMYGEASHIEKALNYLVKKEGVKITMESENVKDGNGPNTGDKKLKGGEKALDKDRAEQVRDATSLGDWLETYQGRVKLSVYKGDITNEHVDVIVNTADNSLTHGSGVAQAIVRKGGQVIEKESKTIIRKRGRLKYGEAVSTKSGKLPCKFVVHAVGPASSSEGFRKNEEILHRACLNSLSEAQKLNMTSIALPAIGSGLCGMPKAVCAKVMIDAVDDFLRQGNPQKKTITDVRFVNIDDVSVLAFSRELKIRFGEDSVKHMCGEGSATPAPTRAEGDGSKAASSRSNRGKNRKKNGPHKDRSTMELNSLSADDNNPFSALGEPSSANADSIGDAMERNMVGKDDSPPVLDHPLGMSTPAADNSRPQGDSYSSALKRNAADKEGSSPIIQHPRMRPEEATNNKEEVCPICLDPLNNPRRLKCKHVFCSGCIQTALGVRNKCPVCQEPQGVLQGDQPPGEMVVHHTWQHLPGYERYGTIVIEYRFPPGVQSREHPNPGQRYYGTSRQAYLPDTAEGREVLQLLGRAFDARLVFTVGTSTTTGLENQITWNDIHHKTNMYGGPSGFGYPDPDYLRRVKEELAAKGIR